MSETISETRHQEATTTDVDPDAELFDWEAFRANGLLWAINRYVLHPRGLAMGEFTADGDDDPCGWQILRSEDGLWSFGDELDHEGQAKFDAFLAYIAARAFLAAVED